MTDWTAAQKSAVRTGKWAVTMTKVRIALHKSKTKWQLVTFNGPEGGESVGIVDMMAVRKNHARCEPPGKRGDLFEIVLIQIKGGGAAFPSIDEIKRLRRVARTYRAKAVLLAQWKPGSEARFFSLKRGFLLASRRDNWIELESLDIVFR